MLKFVVLLAFIAGCLGDEEQPCALDDYKCMGQYMSKFTCCDPNVRGCVSSPELVERFPWDAPGFNMSIVETDFELVDIGGCRVSKFSYFKKYDSLVITITCPELNMAGDRHQLFYHLDEPTIAVDYSATIRYPKFQVTIDLSPENGKDLCKATPFVDVYTPTFTTTPALRSIDGEPEPSYDAYMEIVTDNFNMYLKEKLGEQCKPLYTIFINSFMCNFHSNCYSRFEKAPYVYEDAKCSGGEELRNKCYDKNSPRKMACEKNTKA